MPLQYILAGRDLLIDVASLLLCCRDPPSYVVYMEREGGT